MTLMSRPLAPQMGPEELIDERVCDCCCTALVALPDGELLAAYRDRDGQEVRDIALARRSPGGQWTALGVPFPDGWTIDGCPVNGPALAASGSRVALAWYTLGAGDRPRLRLALSADGARSFARQIDLDADMPMGRIALSYLADGSLALAWLEQVGAEARWLLRRLDGQGAALGETLVLADVRGERSDGWLSLAPQGAGLVALWTDPLGGLAGARVELAP